MDLETSSSTFVFGLCNLHIFIILTAVILIQSTRSWLVLSTTFFNQQENSHLLSTNLSYKLQMRWSQYWSMSSSRLILVSHVQFWILRHDARLIFKLVRFVLTKLILFVSASHLQRHVYFSSCFFYYLWGYFHLVCVKQQAVLMRIDFEDISQLVSLRFLCVCHLMLPVFYEFWTSGKEWSHTTLTIVVSTINMQSMVWKSCSLVRKDQGLG